MTSKVEACTEALMSFYESTTSEGAHGPYHHVQRQQCLLSGLESLPDLLDAATDGRVSPALLEQLKDPILYLVRNLSLEWFTASVLKGNITRIFYVPDCIFSFRCPISVFPTYFLSMGVFP